MAKQIKLTPIRVIRPFFAGFCLLCVFAELSGSGDQPSNQTEKLVVRIADV